MIIYIFCCRRRGMYHIYAIIWMLSLAWKFTTNFAVRVVVGFSIESPDILLVTSPVTLSWFSFSILPIFICDSLSNVILSLMLLSLGIFPSESKQFWYLMIFRNAYLLPGAKLLLCFLKASWGLCFMWPKIVVVVNIHLQLSYSCCFFLLHVWINLFCIQSKALVTSTLSGISIIIFFLKAK